MRLLFKWQKSYWLRDKTPKKYKKLLSLTASLRPSYLNIDNGRSIFLFYRNISLKYIKNVVCTAIAVVCAERIDFLCQSGMISLLSALIAFNGP